jgi:large repetitive protein
MSSRRRLTLIAASVACLLSAAAASADPLNTFSATAAPSHVKPSTSASFAVALSNGLASPDRAQRARIGIPAGFNVSAASVVATTNAVGGCDVSTWIPDGMLIENSKIRLKAPGGNATRLCPGATLTVAFLATTPTTQGTNTWVTELLIDELTPPFTLSGAQPTVIVDGTPPQATITDKPNNPSNVKSPSFGFISNEASIFECKLDAGPFVSCVSPTSYANLADSPHTFTVRAIDTAGNIGASASYGWTIDTFAPTTTVTQKPASLSSTSSATFTFAASEAGSTFACRLDNGSFSSCASPKTYTNLSDGPHTFAVRATDVAGNTGPDVAYGWTIETRSPTAAVTLAPGGLSNSRSATFGFSADEPATFECNLDQRGFEPCSSPATYDGLGDGQHGFSVRARDAVGNFSAPVSQSWTIDATAPETTISSAPKAGTAISATFAFSASEGGTFECRLDGAPFAVCASPKSYSPLRPGDHGFEVRAVDAAGNADPTPALHAWKIQAAVSQISSTALLSPRAGARVKRPPLLVWKRVARAGYYNVQVYRGKVKVFSGWPIRTRLQMKARWTFQGRVRKLSPGTYRWYIWPGFGAPAARRYGSLLGQSTFVVTKR